MERGRTEKYLARHGAPQALAAAANLSGHYTHLLAVPARAEDPSMLDGLAPALQAGSPLLVIVVNGSEDDAPDVHAQNAALLAAMPPTLGAARVLTIDAASPGARLPASEGVGLARKIGFDLGVALAHRGDLEAELLHTTDADATLPADYFACTDKLGEVAAAHYPFWHEDSGEALLDEATTHYELWLRYHAAGLRHAGSPPPHHAVGSCLAVSWRSYVAVRGIGRRRRAGEDFYLLDKLAGEGAVVALCGAPITLAPRLSARVPFGTGPGVHRRLAQLRDGQAPTLPDPRAYDDLAAALRDPDHPAHADVRSGLGRIQFLRARQDDAYPPLSWDEACRQAVFVPTADATPLLHDVRAELAKVDGVWLD